MKLYFLSDQHLNDPKDEKCLALLAFFRSIKSPQDCSHLFLVGDIFDLWIGKHKYFINKWFSFNSELTRLNILGVKIHYFEGNHDLYLNDFFAKQLGFFIHSGPQYFELANLKIRVEHGDQMDKTDYGYRFLRWFLRTRLMVCFAKKLPDQFAVALGQWASKHSRKYTSEVKTIDGNSSREITLGHANKSFKENNFDILVCGHTHTALDQRLNIEGKSVRVVNLGYQQAPLLIEI